MHALECPRTFEPQVLISPATNPTSVSLAWTSITLAYNLTSTLMFESVSRWYFKLVEYCDAVAVRFHCVPARTMISSDRPRIMHMFFYLMPRCTWILTNSCPRTSTNATTRVSRQMYAPRVTDIVFTYPCADGSSSVGCRPAKPTPAPTTLAPTAAPTSQKASPAESSFSSLLSRMCVLAVLFFLTFRIRISRDVVVRFP